MTYEEYMKRRNDLMAEAQGLLDKGDLENAKAKRVAIEMLDAQAKQEADEKAELEKLNGAGMKAPEPFKVEETMDSQMQDDAAAVEKTYRTAFAKMMMGKKMDDAEIKAFQKINDTDKMDARMASTVSTSGDNTAVIPSTMMPEIFRAIGTQHPIINDIMATNITGIVEFPLSSDEGTDAEWTDEATATTAGGVKTGTLKLDGCELVKDVTISWKLKKMSIDAFLAYIVEVVSEKLGDAIANGIINGKGTPGTEDTFKKQPMGIITSLKAEASTPQVSTYTTGKMAYTNITAAVSKIGTKFATGIVLYAQHADIWNLIYGIQDAQGRPIFVPDPTGAFAGRVFGIPVKEEDAVPAGKFVFANSKGYAFNYNEQMMIYSEDHNLARTTDYMGYTIADGGLKTTKAFALLEPSAGA